MRPVGKSVRQPLFAIRTLESMRWLTGTRPQQQLKSCKFHFLFFSLNEASTPPFFPRTASHRTYVSLPLYASCRTFPSLSFAHDSSPSSPALIAFPPRYVSALWHGARPSSLSSWPGNPPSTQEAALPEPSIALGPSSCLQLYQRYWALESLLFPSLGGLRVCRGSWRIRC